VDTPHGIEEVCPDDDVVSRRLDDKVVLVNLRTNRIYALNETGARFWELLGEGLQRTEIERTLRDEFDVKPEQLTEEVDRLLADLIREGLVCSGSA
jgi:Coenzyme PQQ synthesis protein D (PqqD)